MEKLQVQITGIPGCAFLGHFFLTLLGLGDRRPTWRGVLMLCVGSVLLAGCASTPRAVNTAITVEGEASVRGNEPFARLVLKTDQQNTYVLVFESDEERAEVQNNAPAIYRITGEVYRDTWNGRPYAHLRVQAWEYIRG